jgi:group I intron endonuclease
MAKHVFTIYCHTNTVNGKKYVGQTRQSMEQRWTKHVIKALNNTSSSRAFAAAIRKHGPSVFSHEVLDIVATQDGADRAERAWIAHLACMTPDGYNIAAGGQVVHEHYIEFSRQGRAAQTPDMIVARTEKIKAAWTPEKKEVARLKTVAVRATETAEQKREAHRKRLAGMSKEALRAMGAKGAATKAAKLAAMTPEQKEAHSLKLSESRSTESRVADGCRMWAAKSPEEQAQELARLAYLRTRLTPDSYVKMAASRAANWAELPEATREAWRAAFGDKISQRWNSKPQVERDKIVARQLKNIAAKFDSMTVTERESFVTKRNVAIKAAHIKRSQAGLVTEKEKIARVESGQRLAAWRLGLSEGDKKAYDAKRAEAARIGLAKRKERLAAAGLPETRDGNHLKKYWASLSDEQRAELRARQGAAMRETWAKKKAARLAAKAAKE